MQHQQVWFRAQVLADVHRDYRGVLEPALVQAYRETDYCVSGSLSMVLRVGEASSGLPLLYQAIGVECAAFITACNPFSRMLGDDENDARQSRLLGELQQRGLQGISGIGRHPSNDWPGEPSFLVPGLGRDDAMQLGDAFQQNAVVWAGDDASTQLVLLR